MATQGLAPVPALSRLEDLLDASRAAGLRVTGETSGPPTALPPGVELTAYRIIQEALTNAVRHAPGATVCVRVAYGAAHVCVEITNTAMPTVPGSVTLSRGAAGPMTRPAPLRVLVADDQELVRAGFRLILGCPSWTVWRRPES